MAKLLACKGCGDCTHWEIIELDAMPDTDIGPNDEIGAQPTPIATMLNVPIGDIGEGDEGPTQKFADVMLRCMTCGREFNGQLACDPHDHLDVITR